MKHFNIILIFPLLICQCNSKLDKSDLAFKKVLEKGYSTAPGFIVVSIKDSQTGNIKEICTDLVTLYWSFEKEKKMAWNSINKILNSNQNRSFVFTNKEVLTRLGFYDYKIGDLDKIKSDILKNHIVDSLQKFDSLRKQIYDYYFKYRDSRLSLIEQIKDSILNFRKLDNEEQDILDHLDDRYYDDYYTDDVKLSKTGKKLIKFWNYKSGKIRNDYDLLDKERQRQEFKFFSSYIDKFGLNYCHVLFTFGITCYKDCENGRITFGEIIKTK